MERHEYDTLFANEDQHWWFVGTRQVILRVADIALSQIETEREIGCSPFPKVGLPKLLDVGCGTGATLAGFESRNVDRFGIEPEAAAVEFCHRRGLTGVTQGCAESLPFSDGLFDLVMALDVLEHLDDDRAGLAEITRVIRPGGFVLLTVPAHPFLWSEHDVALHHKRRYTYSTFAELIAGQPLRQVVFSYYNCVLFPVVAAVRLVRRFFAAAKPTSGLTSDVVMPHLYVNRLLTEVVASERYVLPHVRLPVGVSLITLCQKI
ncbi:MAG: class I SAM-dependent methyltransferase [Myxococcales bacterium]|nr:class I SAM-dependent methyltransferase [Myxococcales bacterium]